MSPETAPQERRVRLERRESQHTNDFGQQFYPNTVCNFEDWERLANPGNKFTFRKMNERREDF